MQSMSSLIDETIQTVRRIATELRPSILDDLGLISAIEWQTQEFQHRTGIGCSFTTTTRDIALDQERATAIFRILQEALTNVVRHAEATHVKVRFENQTDEIVLDVTDNGKGFANPNDIINSSSLGILGMKERAMLLGGAVTITGAVRRGATVVVRIPHGQSPHPPGDHYD